MTRPWRPSGRAAPRLRLLMQSATAAALPGGAAAAAGAEGQPAGDDGPCPGPLVPGVELRVYRGCLLSGLPPRLDRPGAAMLGVTPAEVQLANNLPSVFLANASAPPIAVQPGATLRLSRIIFGSIAAEDPQTLAQLLLPHFVELEPGAVLAIFDGGKWMALPDERFAALLTKVLGAPDVAEAVRDWKYVLYTDYKSWVHVNWYVGGGVMARSSAVVNAPGALDPLGQAGANFALEVSNASLVQILMRHATVETPDPFLVYVLENCTLWPRDDWPAGGLAIKRPVLLIGWSDVHTALDLGGCSGCASLTGRWSNITFDSLALENLGFGDPPRAGAPGAGGVISAVSAMNMWFFNYSRTEPRIVVRNGTMVLPLEEEVDLVRYWSGVFNSPGQSAWLRRGLDVTAWEARVDSSDGITLSKFVSGEMLIQDTVVTSHQTVFPQRTTAGWDLDHVAGFFRPHLPVPAVTKCDTKQELMAASARLGRPVVCLLSLPRVDLAPDPALRWPPPGGLVVGSGSFLILHGRFETEPLPGTAGGGRRLLGAARWLERRRRRRLAAAAPPGPIEVPAVSVALGYAPSLFAVEHAPSDGGGVLELQLLRLTQLAQGPGAARAASLEDPNVWTLMLWGFQRSNPDALNLSSVVLVLPRQEYAEVQRQRGDSGDFAIYLQGAVITFTGTRYLDANRSELLVKYLEGHMAVGYDVTLTTDPSPDVASPPGYAWPPVGDVGRGGRLAAAIGGGGLPPAAQQALVATLSVAAAAAAALLVFLLVGSWRRQRRRRAAGAAVGGKADASAAQSPRAGGGSGGVNGSGGGGGGASGAGVPTAQCRAGGGGGGGEELSGSGDAFEDGESASGRWRQLLLAINTRVTDIHAKRLAAGLGPGQGGSGSGSGEQLPLAPLPRGAAGTAGDACGQLLALSGGGSYTLGRSAGSFRSAASGSRAAPRHGQPQQLTLLEALGSGTFGTVFRARWHGAEVAVKLVQLPATLLGDPDGASGGANGAGAAGGMRAEDAQAAAYASARERMAIQEAAVSTTMTHPNIVALYCVGLRPVTASGGGMNGGSGMNGGGEWEDDGAWEPRACGGGGDLDGTDSGDAPIVMAWELQLIMEYCDHGTLRQVLDSGRLRDPRTGLTHLSLAVSLAHHVASAMQYLHEESILHGDLKPSNVLLKSRPGIAAPPPGGAADPPDPRALSAKVSDFGLSWCMDSAATHVSACTAGTLTHMSPELLLDGKASKASDVYAFGMLLWELVTGGRAFSSVPKPLLGHAIVQQRLRPVWPPPVVGPAWARLRDLAEACWAHDPLQRPPFQRVVEELEGIEALLAADPAACQLPAAAAAAGCAASLGGQQWWQQACWQGLQTPDACESLSLGGTGSRLAVVQQMQQAQGQQQAPQPASCPCMPQAVAPLPPLMPVPAPLSEQQQQQQQQQQQLLLHSKAWPPQPLVPTPAQRGDLSDLPAPPQLLPQQQQQQQQKAWSAELPPHLQLFAPNLAAAGPPPPPLPLMPLSLPPLPEPAQQQQQQQRW